MPPRLHVDGLALLRGQAFELPAAAARHAQVIRLQPGDAVVVFDGHGTELAATVERIERRRVVLRLGEPRAALPEPPVEATLAVVVPANDRMDAVIEKATELGAAAVQPLVSQRSVWRLDGARAAQRRAHWQAVAIAASEQCGRARVPQVHEPLALAAWLARDDLPELRLVLTPATATAETGPAPSDPMPALSTGARIVALSGPEGGLTPDEVARARARGFRSWTLGPRVLRADTAPIAWLAHLMVSLEAPDLWGSWGPRTMPARLPSLGGAAD